MEWQKADVARLNAHADFLDSYLRMKIRVGEKNE
jgi:hypothetical protein